MRRFTNEPLYVAPALVGARLASPMRRVLAFVVDWLLIIVPTVIVSVGAAFLSLHASDPRAARAVSTLFLMAFEAAPARGGTPAAMQQAEARKQANQRRKTEAFRDLSPLLVRIDAPGVPAAVKVAVEEGNLNRAADLLKDHEITFALQLSEGGEEPPGARSIVLNIEKLIPRGIRVPALLGVPALYFVLFTRSRRGATIGKWLFGIRVVRLDGEPLSALEALERFVGYVHIPATLFLTLADLWRDPNRRLPHDRSVHTAVFRMPRRAASVEAHAAQA